MINIKILSADEINVLPLPYVYYFYCYSITKNAAITLNINSFHLAPRIIFVSSAFFQYYGRHSIDYTCMTCTLPAEHLAM